MRARELPSMMPTLFEISNISSKKILSIAVVYASKYGFAKLFLLNLIQREPSALSLENLSTTLHSESLSVSLRNIWSMKISKITWRLRKTQQCSYYSGRDKTYIFPKLEIPKSSQ